MYKKYKFAFNMPIDELISRFEMQTLKFSMYAYYDYNDSIFFAHRWNRIRVFKSAYQRKKGCSMPFHGVLKYNNGATELAGRFKLPLPFRVMLSLGICVFTWVFSSADKEELTVRAFIIVVFLPLFFCYHVVYAITSRATKDRNIEVLNFINNIAPLKPEDSD